MEVCVKITTALFVGPLAALLLITGSGSVGAAQTAAPKTPGLVVASMVGRDLFEFYCSSCHGRDGKGGGHAASALKVPPPDLTILAQRNHGTFPTDKVAAFIKGEGRLSSPAHGSWEMPVWGPIFKGLDNRDAVNAARIENLVKYIASIQAKATA
jgi:mono/diheme cytochrome c family protein